MKKKYEKKGGKFDKGIRSVDGQIEKNEKWYQLLRYTHI